jgi:hypothetical protein
VNQFPPRSAILTVRDHLELTGLTRRNDGFNVQALLDEGRETRDLGTVVLSRRAMNDFDLHFRRGGDSSIVPKISTGMVGQDLGVRTVSLLQMDHYLVHRKMVQTILRRTGMVKLLSMVMAASEINLVIMPLHGIIAWND